MAVGKRMGFVAAWLVAFALAGPVWAGEMSMAEFRLELRDAIHKLAPKATIEMVGEDTLRVSMAGAKPDDGASMYVGNAYARYLNKPEALETIVGQMARTVLAIDAPAPATKESLIVLIRPADYVRQPGFDKIKFVTRPFAGDFIEIVAVDSEESFQMAAADKMIPLLGDEAAIWTQAEANTRAKMGKLRIEALEPGVWTVTNDSSLALNFVDQPDLWPIHGLTMTGDPVAVFMQRNLLLLADGGDKDRLQRVATFVKQVGDDPETMSTTIFTRRNGVWSVLEQRP